MDAAFKAKFKEVLDGATQKGLLSSMEVAYALLKEHGYMYHLQVHSKLIGCHEGNRDGFGVDPEHVHSLVDRFHDMGFVPSAGRYMAVEIPMGAQGDTTREFNQKLAASSKDLFLACDIVSIKGSVVTITIYNIFFFCICVAEAAACQ